MAIDTPLGLRVTEHYRSYQRHYDRAALERIARGDDPLDFDRLYGVTRASDSRRLADVEQPMLIIAGSGMCTGGRVVGHLQQLLPLEETHVLFVGYQDHWPSRSGGQYQSEPFRMLTGETLAYVLDGVKEDDPGIPVLVTGDFNDEPFNRSMQEYLLGTRDPR